MIKCEKYFFSFMKILINKFTIFMKQKTQSEKFNNKMTKCIDQNKQRFLNDLILNESFIVGFWTFCSVAAASSL